LTESDGDSSSSDGDSSSAQTPDESAKSASKSRLAAKAAAAKAVTAPSSTPDESETKRLIARIKALKAKVLSEEKAATALEQQVAKQTSSLDGVLTTAKDDREEGDKLEDQAKKVILLRFWLAYVIFLRNLTVRLTSAN
jgi:hypothetical protein